MHRLTELDRSSNQAVVYMIREITHICRDMKKRSPGSEGERDTGDYMADILRKNCGCKDVKSNPSQRTLPPFTVIFISLLPLTASVRYRFFSVPGSVLSLAQPLFCCFSSSLCFTNS